MNGEDQPKVEMEEEVVAQSPSQNLSPSFSPSIIPSLSTMSSDQLSQLEEELSQEFASISREYVRSRGTRIDHLIEVIDKHLSVFREHDHEWTQKYAYEVDLIASLIHGTEDAVLTRGAIKDSRVSNEKFEEELHELMANLHSPLATDGIFSTRVKELPFAHQFEKTIEPYKKQLKASWSQKDYQINMIDTVAENNKVISWKQYRQDVLNYRQKLIDQTYSELASLYEEYHGIRDNALAVQDEVRYHRSVISTDDIKYGAADYEQARLARGNIDSFLDIDNAYYKNNKIATTRFKTEALRAIGAFESAQATYTIPQVENAVVKLSGCQGLSEQEADNDLALIRCKKRKVDPGSIIRAEPDRQSEYQEVLATDKSSSQIVMAGPESLDQKPTDVNATPTSPN